MRINYSIKNSLSSFLSYIFSIIFGFISQSFFIKILGLEYLGINNILTNLFLIVSIFDFGINNIITYNLYKPVANNDHKKINSYIYFYKKYLKIIILIIIIISLLLIPFLKFIIKDNIYNINIIIIYILFLISLILTNILNYKKTLIYVNQKNYIINIIHIIYLIILNILQLIILFKTNNYYLFLIIKLICQILEIILISLYNKKYYNYQTKEIIIDENDILKNIKNIFLYKLSALILNNADSILISSFLGIKIVALYANYYLIINSLNSLFGEIIKSIGSSVANLLTENNVNKNYQVFKRINFLNFYLASLSGICLLNITDIFIEIWLGREYVFNNLVLFFLVFYHFLRTIRCSYELYLEGIGIWKKDIKTPIFQIGLYLILSVIFINLLGLIGLILGGIVSILVLYIYTYPKYIYRNLFNLNIKVYIKELLINILVFIILLFINNNLIILININNIYLDFLLKIIISLIIPNLYFFIIYRKNNNYLYFKELIKKILINRKKCCRIKSS